VLIESADFIGNESAGDGCALSIGAITGSVDILDALFAENAAALDGGRLHIFGHNDDGRSRSNERTSLRTLQPVVPEEQFMSMPRALSSNSGIP
jgi:hypothetical protein